MVLLILVGAGEFKAALHKLVDMSLSGTQAPAARSPFSGLTNPGTTGQSAPASTPAPAAAPKPRRR